MSGPQAAWTPPPCEAVLLAAGAGRRLGQPKALLELHGRWMLPQLVRALLSGGATQVHVVLRTEELALIRARGLPAAAQLLVNPEPERGRGASLAIGLAAIPADSAVLVHPCDVPLLSADAVRRLLLAWSPLRERERWVVRPVTAGGRGGHPLLLGTERAAAARALPADRSLRELVHADPARRLDVVMQEPGPFLDVDTPEQRLWIESLLPG